MKDLTTCQKYPSSQCSLKNWVWIRTQKQAKLYTVVTHRSNTLLCQSGLVNGYITNSMISYQENEINRTTITYILQVFTKGQLHTLKLSKDVKSTKANPTGFR